MSRDETVGFCSVKYGKKVYNDSNYEDMNNLFDNNSTSPGKIIKDIQGASQYMVDFLQGTGFMELTFLFYGNYRYTYLVFRKGFNQRRV